MRKAIEVAATSTTFNSYGKLAKTTTNRTVLSMFFLGNLRIYTGKMGGCYYP